MKTITKEFKVFEFKELSEEAKEKVLEKFREEEAEMFDLNDYLIPDLSDRIKEELNLNVDSDKFECEMFSRSNHLSLPVSEVLSALHNKYPELEDLDLPDKFGVYTNYLGGGLASNLMESEIGENSVVLEGDDEEQDEGEDLRRNLLRIKIKEDLEKLQTIMGEAYKGFYEAYNETMSDENIIDLIENNEYQFLEGGEIF